MGILVRRMGQIKNLQKKELHLRFLTRAYISLDCFQLHKHHDLADLLPAQ